MTRFFILLVILASQSAFAADFEKIIDGDGHKSWISTEFPKIQISRNQIDAADSKPTSAESAESYVRTQESVRSWINRVMGISNFTIRKQNWNPKTNTLTFSGDYMIGLEKQLFREEHVFLSKIETKQINWPESSKIDNTTIDRLWKMSP